MRIWHKITNSKSVRSTFLYTLTSFVNQFGGLLVLPLIWRGLSIEDFATIGYIEAAVPFLGCVLTLSVEQYLTRFYYIWAPEERRMNTEKNLTLGFMLVLGLGAISSLTMLAINWVTPLNDFELFFYGLCHIVFYSSFTLPNSLFRISGNTRAYMVFMLSSFGVRLVLNYVFTIELAGGLRGYIISNALNSFLFFVGIYSYLFRKYSFRTERAFFTEAIRFSFPYIPTNLMNNVATLADRMVLGIYGGKFEAGVLTLGQKIASITGSLSQALKLGYVPFISEFVSKEEYTSRKLNNSRMLFVAPVSALSFILILFADEVLALVGIVVPEVNNYLYLFLLIIYLNSTNLFFSPGLYLSKRSDRMWIPNLIQLAVRVALYFLLVPKFKLMGVLMASLISSLVLFLHNYYLSEKYFPLKLKVSLAIVQFLPFIVTMLFAGAGVSIFALAFPMKVGMSIFYLLILWFFLVQKHENLSAPTA